MNLGRLPTSRAYWLSRDDIATADGEYAAGEDRSPGPRVPGLTHPTALQRDRRLLLALGRHDEDRPVTVLEDAFGDAGPQQCLEA